MYLQARFGSAFLGVLGRFLLGSVWQVLVRFDCVLAAIWFVLVRFGPFWLVLVRFDSFRSVVARVCPFSSVFAHFRPFRLRFALMGKPTDRWRRRKAREQTGDGARSTVGHVRLGAV